VIQSFNLDTRRDVLTSAADLNEAGDLIPLVSFDAPDDLRSPARLTLVAMGEARTSTADFGWQHGASVAAETELKPGGSATLAVSRTWLSERVAVLRTLGGAEGLARVDLPFSTILAMPRAPRASQKRILRIAVAASAGKPAARFIAAPLDIDKLQPSAADAIARIEIDVPTDIVFEENRTLVVDLGCAGFPPESLSLAPESGANRRFSLREAPAAAPNTLRRLLTIDDPADMAGQLVRLVATLQRGALLGAVDRLLAEGQGTPAPLRMTARIAGWGDGSAPASAEAPDKRWVLQLPLLQVPVQQSTAGSLLVSLDDTVLSTVLDQTRTGQTAHGKLPPFRVELDPDDAENPVSFDGMKLSILRWPLGRAGSVEITAESVVAGETVAEPAVVLTPNIDRKQGLTRQAQSLLPFRALLTRLTRLARAREVSSTTRNVMIRLRLSTGGTTFLTAEAPVEIRRCTHRLPICIDLGASAISVWSGQPHAPGETFNMRPLAIGSWLAAHVDPEHEEALSVDGEAAILIPSHVSLDPLNHLRSDHAPQTLPDFAMIGPDREAARARMRHFQRRYDVSVPAPPPIARSRSSTRRITGIKRALATGQLALTLPDPVNRLDLADGRVTQTAVIDVAPLAADVIDEIIDLYVMRLGQENVHADMMDPAPVIPRIIITCPSGIGAEITSRYGLVLDILRKRLERLFPGASQLTDTAEVLPEAIAAARYAAELLKPQLADVREPVMVITLDLGGSTSDVALAEVSAIAGRVDRFRPLTTFGLPIGGQAMDDALMSIVCHHADAFAATTPGWSVAGGALSVARAAASQEANAIPLQQWLASALQRGKTELAEKLAAKAHRSGAPYAWKDGEGSLPLRVILSEEQQSGWRGLLLPSGDLAQLQSEHAVADGVHAVMEGEPGKRRLSLHLARAAIDDQRTPGVKRLQAVTEALGRTLQRMARSAVPRAAKRPRVMVVPTGRAALWPPLFETLANEAAAGRDEFPFVRPLDPATMKKAVVAGAALLSSTPEAAARQPALACPIGLAVAGAHLTEDKDGALRTGSVAERVYYATFAMADGDRLFAAEDAENPSLAARVNLGQRFQFVRAVPGLDPMGHVLSRLRDVLDHEDPLLLLEGDVTVDAKVERLDRFGVCELESTTDGSGRRKITVTARDRNWQGAWAIDGDRVSRLY
jgi:hypothetical protein